MNTANISSNLGTGAVVASREGTGRKRQAKKIFDNSTESMLVKKFSVTSKKTRLAKDSPFKTRASKVFWGGEFTPSKAPFSPCGDTSLHSNDFANGESLILFSPGTITLLQGSPKPTTSSMVRTVGVAFSTSNKLDLDECSDSETSVASGSTDPISTSSSDSSLFELSDSCDEVSRDSFSSQGASSEVGGFVESDIDLNSFGFVFPEFV